MKRLFSNGPGARPVASVFDVLAAGSNRLYLAAPYFTYAKPAIEAAQAGKSVQLLVGLNVITRPRALEEVTARAGVAVRYLTSRFHAKIYVFERAALVGSSNLTDEGFFRNREAVLAIDGEHDAEALEETKALFLELWQSARVLTPEVLAKFAKAYAAAAPPRSMPDPDAAIEAAVGRVEPPNIHVRSTVPDPERLYIDDLQRRIYERFRPGFNEVGAVLTSHAFRRPELAHIGEAHETNRFLSWLRLTHIEGDAWRNSPQRSDAREREVEIASYGRKWKETDKTRIPDEYFDWLARVKAVFASPATIRSASQDDLTDGLMSLHAFSEQSRFVKGGESGLRAGFWAANGGNVESVKSSLSRLLHGEGDFAERLHDALYDKSLKVAWVGQFCALELYGTIRPDEYPPINGRMAKAMRFLGFDVPGA